MIYDLQQYRRARAIYDPRQFRRDIRAILRHRGHREQVGFFTRQVYRDSVMIITDFHSGSIILQFHSGISFEDLRMDSPEAEHILRLAIGLEELGFDLDTDPVFL